MINNTLNKPTIKERFYRFFIKDYDAKVSSARSIKNMLVESTKGSINHFYDINGERIRGYSNTVIRSRYIEHPLIKKYK